MDRMPRLEFRRHAYNACLRHPREKCSGLLPLPFADAVSANRHAILPLRLAVLISKYPDEN